MYELINQELGVYSCRILDLTLEQAYFFTELWNDGSSIESLTVFNDEDGRIIINKDHKQFETFKDMVLDYMQLTEEEKEEIKTSIKSKTFNSIFEILDNVLRYKEKKKKDEEFQALKSLLGKQSIPQQNELSTVWNIRDSYKLRDESLALIEIYNYGVIQGKRAERARKKLQAGAIA